MERIRCDLKPAMFEENFVQIAGVIDRAEAEMLQQCGVRYLGFPLRLPVHREDLRSDLATAPLTPGGSIGWYLGLV